VTQKAVVLLSGGMDSATVLAIARAQGHECQCLTVDYGQRHRAELAAAARVARAHQAGLHTVQVDLGGFGGSALTDHRIAVPEAATDGIPVTYVPARNTIFLALALAWAEVLGARDIWFGANAVDYSGYPDCRPEFMRAFEALANLATKAAVEGNKLTVHTPIIHLSKADIIRRGTALGVDYAQTVSCYNATDEGLAAAAAMHAACAGRASTRLAFLTSRATASCQSPDARCQLLVLRVEFWRLTTGGWRLRIEPWNLTSMSRCSARCSPSRSCWAP
jgi:7-cyano-7-deazaguanine synthase